MRTVEEIKADMAATTTLEAKINYEHELKNALFDAWKAGRCVVLPCKVGDAVYVIADCADMLKMCDDDYWNGTGAITCPFGKDCEFEECDDANRRIAETTCTGFWQEGDGEWKVFFDYITADIGISDFGKTVFLTPDEATAALKEDEG